MHISSVIKISFCRISFSGHQNKFCACLDSIYGSRVMCKNCSDIRWHRLNSNQSKTNCPKNLNSDGLIVREMGPWPECIFRSLLQFLVIVITDPCLAFHCGYAAPVLQLGYRRELRLIVWCRYNYFFVYARWLGFVHGEDNYNRSRTSFMQISKWVDSWQKTYIVLRLFTT